MRAVWRVFVIAKRGRRYRQLVAIDLQITFKGNQILWRTFNVLRIFSSPANRVGLEQELAYLQELENSARTGAESNDLFQKCQRREHCAFPFITTCAYLGVASCPATGDLRNDAAIHSPENDLLALLGHEGSVVIDITDLDRVKYCLCVPSNMCFPTDAEVFYDHHEDEMWPYLNGIEETEAVIDRLKGFGIVSRESLAIGLERQTQQSPKSLLDLSISKLLDALSEPDDEAEGSLLEEMLNIGSVKAGLISHCHQYPEKLERSSSMAAVSILQAILEDQESVDLSRYRNMSPDAIRAILQRLKEVRVLNLSGLEAASEKEISKTLAAIDHPLDELYILDPPNRGEDQDPMPLIRAIGEHSHSINRIISSSILSRSLTHRPWMVPDRVSPSASRGTSRSSHSSLANGLSDSFPILQILYSFQPNKDDEARITEAYYLGDGLLTPRRVISGLLSIFLSDRQHRSRDWRNGAFFAHAFATAGSHWQDRESAEINTLPAEAFTFGKCFSKGLYSRVRDLTPDTWTIVLDDRREFPDTGVVLPELKWGAAMLRSKKVITAQQGRKIRRADVEVVDLASFLEKYLPNEGKELREAFQTEIVDVFECVEHDDQYRPQDPPDEFVSPLSDMEAVRIVNRVFAGMELNRAFKEQSHIRGI